MNSKKLMGLYGIKWNPFSCNLPLDGIHVDPSTQDFLWRVENLVMDGGFAMITGPVGTGKSVSMRWLAHRLNQLQDVQVAEYSRPQSGLADFYRELGNLFGLGLQVSNRFSSFRTLREKWIAHIDSTLFRPVLLIDEAQEMLPVVLSELRLISAKHFDSRSIITVILCGDERLPDRFRHPDLIPLGSRIKTRLLTEHKSRDELETILSELLKKAGNPNLMSKDLILTLADRSMGNYRALMHMADTLLSEGYKRELPQLDDRLFLELYDPSKSSLHQRRTKK